MDELIMGHDSTILAEETGRILSRLHWQAWRTDAPTLDLEPSELVAALPHVIRLASVGLVWPRLQGQLDRFGAIAMALENAYQAQLSHNMACQREIAQAVTRLREEGIEPVLVKGLAISRMYPPPLVRPAGDIDLVVRYEAFARSAQLLAGLNNNSFTAGFDLKHPANWDECPNDDFWNRTLQIEVDGVLVTTLGAEDQLKMMCIHFLKHEGMRPIWLTDIALAVESRPPEFDWSLLLESGDVERTWIAATIALAHQLVGLRVNDLPVMVRAKSQPSWLVRLVFRRWHDPKVSSSGATVRLMQNPLSVWSILADHWPGPLVATVFCRAAINSVPRLPWQVLLSGRRLFNHVLHEMPRQLRAGLRARRMAR